MPRGVPNVVANNDLNKFAFISFVVIVYLFLSYSQNQK